MKRPYSAATLVALSLLASGAATSSAQQPGTTQQPGTAAIASASGQPLLRLPEAPDSSSLDNTGDNAQQTTAPAAAPPYGIPPPEPVTFLGTPKRFVLDQKAIWTSPIHLRAWDAAWLVPLAATTGVLIGSDHHTMTALLQIRANDQRHFNTFSDAGVIALGAVPAAMYLWSLPHYAPQARETGLLAGEALADTLVFTRAVELVSRRDAPTVDDAQGHFFSSGPGSSSFPSDHAAAAWSLAAVVSDEYPGLLTKTAAYGLASAVSVSRVLAEKHFPSDVLIGSAAGWLIGHYVYHAHHDRSLDFYNDQPAAVPYLARPQIVALPASTSSSVPPGIDVTLGPNAWAPPAQAAPRPPRLYDDFTDPDTIGSPYVPMDSWIYPALARLAAMGFIPGQSTGIRPWTRQECLRQLRQAEDLVSSYSDLYGSSLITEANRLIADLHQELETEPAYYSAVSFDEAYSRYGAIAGPAIADSFHFGQTWWNDYGRPLGQGGSAILGYEMRANYGRLFFYDRQEGQHGPGYPPESPELNALFNVLDRPNPGGTGTGIGADPIIAPLAGITAYNRQRPLELYAGIAFAGNALSFGKQELYWGPTTMGPLAFSMNAEPTWNLQFVSNRPHPLPFFPSLGTYRFDIVIGKLSGHKYPARPWFNGQKAQFNFGNDFELSFTRWSIFWGVGHPITFHTFKMNVFSFDSTGGGANGLGGSIGYGDRDDPGDRKSNFDFSWHLPFLSRVVTLYADAYSDDDPSPIDAPRRALWNPGIYFARLPWMPHMDLRVEAVSSEGLAHDYGGLHYFINDQYLDGNTNKGFLLGNAIGRDSRAIEARSGYWFSAKNRIEGGYRQNKGGSEYLPGGSTITDGFVNGSWAFKEHWQAQVFGQYERFLIPSYMAGAQHNTSGWLQITWTPALHLAH